jgi:peptide deformylase
VRGEEGCLSIPEVYGDVERSARVVVRGLDEQGRPLEVEGTDLLARCLQHEIDHLHGRLFIDYFSTLKKRSAKAKWERERVKYPTGIRKLDPAEIAAQPRRRDAMRPPGAPSPAWLVPETRNTKPAATLAGFVLRVSGTAPTGE